MTPPSTSRRTVCPYTFRHADRNEDCKKAEYECACLEASHQTLKKDMARAAPKEAPASTPRRLGETRGLNEHGLKRCADTEREAPIRRADMDARIASGPPPPVGLPSF